MITSDQLTALSQPFDAGSVNWKPGATNRDKTKALALAYADSRAYFDRLDQVDPAWSDSYEISPDGQRVVCRLTVAGVTRCDVGECDGGDANTTTSAAAQAFKRAAAKFGLGRYLYRLPRVWVEYDGDRRQFTAQALAQLAQVAGGNGAGRNRQPSPSDNGAGAFASPEAAIAWAMGQGVFKARQHAAHAYEKCKREAQPKTAAEMAQAWRDDVAQRLSEAQAS